LNIKPGQKGIDQSTAVRGRRDFTHYLAPRLGT
jgi:hypothetical protein